LDKTIDFSIENNNGNCLLKLQNGDVWELNIRLKKDEMNLLKNIKKSDWDNRKSI
jgi:hypothetical protein